MHTPYRDSSRSRPDRGLKVEATFDRRIKNITFASCRNCSYDLLCAKVEKAFSLHSSSYAIAFKDDDGEVSNIQTDDDLTEAIQYFQAGIDDRMSIISGFSNGSFGSFGSRHRITLKVHVTVDYDGRLSDTGSIAPLDDEYRHRPRSMDSFSLNGSLSGPVDDDQMTVSSRDRPNLAQPAVTKVYAPGSVSLDGDGGDNVSYLARDEQYERARAQQRDSYIVDPRLDRRESHRSNVTGVFERLRRDEERMPGNIRNEAWLQEQGMLAEQAYVGRTPPPSNYRISLNSHLSLPDGELELERDRRGKYYYSYTSSSVSGPRSSIGSAAALSRVQSLANHRPQSGLNHSALPPIPEPPSDSGSGSASGSAIGSGYKPTVIARNYAIMHPDPPPDIPPELLEDNFQVMPGGPPEAVSECSACAQLLDVVRYVCATCGPRNKGVKDGVDDGGPHKGKARDPDARAESVGGSPSLYPPTGWGGHSATSHSSPTLVGEQRLRVQTSTSTLGRNGRTCGSPPTLSPGSTLHSPAGSMRSRGTSPPGANPEGYELCVNCVNEVGVVHALDAGLAPAAPSPSVVGEHHLHSPSESHRSFSEWKRLAPRMKGLLRHAYLEQMLGPNGWEDLEHDDHSKGIRCSTCNSVILQKRYKCLPCEHFNLCKACYSQVHEIHPSHVFLEIRDKQRTKSDSDSVGEANQTAEPTEGTSLRHPGVRCAHCMLEVVGARFHCAECDDVDICFNCESAGLPGNLDSSDGGHSSQHIMIKIPVPLENNTVESLSRQTVHLWTGRDAPHLGDDHTSSRERSESVHSNHRTVVAPSGVPSLTRAVLNGETAEHHIVCDNCEQTINGVRYQCASCPSAPASYNLCASCEPRSYIVHDPMHVFFKLPRPVHKALASARPFVPPLYKTPAGPGFGNADPSNPTDYLRSLLHSAVMCDRCMERIQGEWYWCVYCAKDLCDEHEAVDTHDNTHVFIVFKSAVDMNAFKRFTQLDAQQNGPRVIPYPIYFA